MSFAHRSSEPLESALPSSLPPTLPPTSIEDLLTAEGARIAVLTVDGQLSETAHEAARRKLPIALVFSWRELMSGLKESGAGIVLLDTEFVGAGLVDRLDQLHEAHPGTVVLLAAPRDTATGLTPLLLNRRAHRVLLKPASVEETRLLLESAVASYLERREQAGVAAPASPHAPQATPARHAPHDARTLHATLALHPPLPSRARRPRRRSRRVALAGALVAALLAGETLLAPSLDGEDPNASATDRFQASLLAAPVSIADLPFQASGAAAYPPDALAGGIEGSVRLEFIVDTDGKPLNPRVVDADPPGWFESAALETIHDYRFRPYERDGTAYQRLVRARIGFSLD